MSEFEVVVRLAATVRLLWVVAGFVIDFCKLAGRERPESARRVFAELRPFYLPAVGIAIADWTLSGEMLGWNALWSALALLTWFMFKDIDEDDRWKRRRRKVAEKVTRIGGRLAVVPAEAGTR